MVTPTGQVSTENITQRQRQPAGRRKGKTGRGKGSDGQTKGPSLTTSVTMNGSSTSSSSGGISPTDLAAMLRKSADVVERQEFHPLLYQTMRALTAYAADYADGSIKAGGAPPSLSTSSAATKQAQQQKSRQRVDAPGSEANNKDRDGGDLPGMTPAKPENTKIASAFSDVPDVLDASNGRKKKGGHNLKGSMTGVEETAVSGGAAAAAARVGAPGGAFSSAASAAAAGGVKNAGNKQENGRKPNQTPSRGKVGVFNHEGSHQNLLRGKGAFIRKGLKKIEKMGVDILGDNEKTFDKGREDAPFDERKNEVNNNSNEKQYPGVTSTASIDSTFSPHQQQQQHQTPAKPLRQSQTANTTSNAVNDPEKPAKPCFQRPINPNSNLIANGWIDQQRRSKMRVVWKDILASLVEGRRPGEETTLWIQRQVINAQTGKVTGLEALHQIPMKWLEDVNYVDIYGDHRFNLKVYNIAEEFYFRTRDEQSAQSWVLTLRSARDASLEGNVRMLGAPASSAGSEGTEKAKPLPKDVGLQDSDDMDLKKQNPIEGMASGPPLAQSVNDGGADSHPSSSPPQTRPQQQQQQPQQQQQAQPAASARKPISELRAIAHGAGYNTRGMERQDLERIAAHVHSGSYNPNPPASVPPAAFSAGYDKVQQSTQHDAAMREAEQRAAAEKQQEQHAKAQKQAQEEEAARRQKEVEERVAVEKMRREREAAEKKRVDEQMAAAEQQRRRHELEQQAAQQAADIKRQQEEDRHRKMAELLATEQARQQQQQQQQAQAQAAATMERKKREEEEQRRRQQQQQQQQQQQAQQHHQQQQAQRPGQIPSPPTSGNYPQGNFQPQQQPQWGQQQQQHFQQWQQHQQHQQAHFQQQGFPGQQQQAGPQQHHQQFFNQNMPPQGAYQQQQHQPQQQHAHFQQPQQQQHPQQPATANPQGANPPPNSKYAKQMEEKNDEEDQSAVTQQIKRSILINWALQPPNLNVLRPIDQLISTIHTAMPPAFGVASHAYFSKFTPISQTELVLSAAMGNRPDETKLKKAVRKVRVFLHPDKLPRDLTTDQQYMARMLWDITSDSWEEFQKHKDELDWMHS